VIELTTSLLRGLRGQMAWRYRYDGQLGLQVEFGRPRLEELPILRPTSRSFRRLGIVRRRPRVCAVGTWYLFGVHGSWRLLYRDRPIARPSSSVRVIHETRLDGLKVLAVHVDDRTGRTAFRFEEGFVLDLRRDAQSPADEIWIMRKPSGYYLSVYGNGRYDHGPGAGNDRRRGVKGRPLRTLRRGVNAKNPSSSRSRGPSRAAL